MTQPHLMKTQDLVGLLTKHLSMLDSAAIPTKSEVFAICGSPARELHDALAEAASRIQALEAENAGLRQDVIAFCAPWAVNYARDRGYPPGHLHPAHYDILARCGGRMVDFTRHNETRSALGGEG